MFPLMTLPHPMSRHLSSILLEIATFSFMEVQTGVFKLSFIMDLINKKNLSYLYDSASCLGGAHVQHECFRIYDFFDSICVTVITLHSQESPEHVILDLQFRIHVGQVARVSQDLGY